MDTKSKDKGTDNIHNGQDMDSKSKSKNKVDFIEDEQLLEYKEAFDLFDKDGSGAISMEELGQVMKGLGFCPQDGELRDMIREYDTDESGQIEFEEFCELMARQKSCGDDDDSLRAAFNAFDKDGSGKISSDELRQVMTSLGERLTDDEIEEMIREADCDGDGQIDYNEFAVMMVGKIS